MLFTFLVGAMNLAYGFKHYPLNGPFPRDITVRDSPTVTNGAVLKIKYDQAFSYNSNTSAENSGFFYCCGGGALLEKCDAKNYNWPVLPKESVVSVNEAEQRLVADITSFLYRHFL